MSVGGDATREATTPARLRALAAAALVLAATLHPLTWPRGQDSFPLTPYPMFAESRPDASVVVVVAMGRGPTGMVALPTEATGHGQLTQAVRALSGAVAAGGDRPARLCAEVARWVFRSDMDDLDAVGIVTASWDAIAYLVRDERRPQVLAEHAWCEVAP